MGGNRLEYAINSVFYVDLSTSFIVTRSLYGASLDHLSRQYGVIWNPPFCLGYTVGIGILC